VAGRRGAPPGALAREAEQDGEQHQPHQERVEEYGDPSTMPISLGGRGPESAKVKNTATNKHRRRR
jgi:hypothetical protein